MYGNITSAKCPWIIGHIAMYICRSGNIAERGYKQGGVILKIYFGPLLKCSSDLLGQRLTIPAYLIFVILFTDKILGSKILHPKSFENTHKMPKNTPKSTNTHIFTLNPETVTPDRICLHRRRLWEISGMHLTFENGCIQLQSVQIVNLSPFLVGNF